MPFEQLIQSVDECAEDKIRGIRERATRKAAEIQDEVAGKDVKIQTKHHDAAQTAVEMERSKSVAQIKKESRMQMIRAKDAVYQEAFSQARKHLLSVRERQGYENNFKKMVPVVLRIDKQDESLAKTLLPNLHLDCGIVTDITTEGGVEVRTTDGRFVIKNTIESRLERAKVLIKPEIFATLYGDQGGV
jgi:V/A-type H+-transporting ATPase subunit E